MKHLPAVAWRLGVVTMVVVVVVVVAPKWNEKRKNEPGRQGTREVRVAMGRGRLQPMGSTYPSVVVVGRTSGRRWWWWWRRIHAL